MPCPNAGPAHACHSSTIGHHARLLYRWPPAGAFSCFSMRTRCCIPHNFHTQNRGIASYAITQMPRTISIIGAGRVGQTIAKRLHKLGWRIGAVVTRSRRTARVAVRAIGAGTPHAALTPEALDADVILLSVPDDLLETVAQRLAKIAGPRLSKKSPAKVALHTSGALDHRVLTPL